MTTSTSMETALHKATPRRMATGVAGVAMILLSLAGTRADAGDLTTSTSDSVDLFLLEDGASYADMHSALGRLQSHCKAGKPVYNQLTGSRVGCTVAQLPEVHSDYAVLSAEDPTGERFAVYGLQPPQAPPWKRQAATASEIAQLQQALPRSATRSPTQLLWKNAFKVSSGTEQQVVWFVPDRSWEKPDDYLSGQDHHVFVSPTGRPPVYQGTIPDKPRAIVPVPGKRLPAVMTGISCDGICLQLQAVTEGLPVIATVDGH